MGSLDAEVRRIVREELSQHVTQPTAVDRSEKVAVSVAEAAKLVGYSDSFMRTMIHNHHLVASYANSKAVIEIEELRRWVRSLPNEVPRNR